MQPLARRQFLGRSATGFLGAASAWVMPWAVAANAATGMCDESIDPGKADLIYRSRAPRNGEPPLDKLVESWITPTPQFYIRSHGPNPQISDDFRVSIEGLVERPQEFTVQQLLEKFPASSCTCTVGCAGLRRYEFNKMKKVGGVQWEEGPIGNAVWSGIRLSDVLKHVGLKAGAKHVWFDGADAVPEGDHTIPFGGSVPLSKMQDEDKKMPGVLLATHINGQPLPPDHGFPIRTVVPGYIGARSVKWLQKIVVSEASSPNHYVADAYKMVQTGAAIEWDEAPPIYRYIVNAALCSAEHKDGEIHLKGFALPSGYKDCSITRVEISTDSGKSWSNATLGKEAANFCWQLWTATVTITNPESDICVRATDSLGNTMPETVPWNPKGYLYNAWHRVPAKGI